MKTYVHLDTLRMNSNINLDLIFMVNITWAKQFDFLKREPSWSNWFLWKECSKDEMVMKLNSLHYISWTEKFTNVIIEDSDFSNSSWKYRDLQYTQSRKLSISEFRKYYSQFIFISKTQLKMLILENSTNKVLKIYLASVSKEHKILRIRRPFNKNIMRKTYFQTRHGCNNNLFKMCKSFPSVVGKSEVKGCKGYLTFGPSGALSSSVLLIKSVTCLQVKIPIKQHHPATWITNQIGYIFLKYTDI